MRGASVGVLLGCALFVICPVLRAQVSPKAEETTVPDRDRPFSPRDLSGVWRDAGASAARRTQFGSPQPEPPLTDWGKQHLFAGGITHGKHVTISGGFPGQGCDPIAAPAQFAYLQFYPMEILQLPNRIHQDFELHGESRDIWIGEEHPKDLWPTYMGNSVGKWDGNTLVVDTIGYNGKDWITEDIDHPMSDQFHLVERYTRTSYNTLKIEMTFYDPKYWGDQAWGGWTRTLKLQNDRLEEWLCVPEIDAKFNQKVMKPAYDSAAPDKETPEK